MNIQNVVINPEWKASQSRAEQARVLRNTLPKHFALSKNFTWTYLYLDQALTSHPSQSHKAQAYTAVLKERAHVSRSALYAIKLGFAGAFLTIIGTTFSHHLASRFASANWASSDSLEDHMKTGLFLLAAVSGIAAIWLAKKAERDLAKDPDQRGRALAIYGLLSGAAAAGIGFGNLEALSDIPTALGIIQWFVVMGVGSAFVLLF